MNIALQNQRTPVTAGGSGIGRVIAEHLIEAEARCMVCDVDAAAFEDCAGKFGAGLAVHADVSDEAQVDTLFGQVKQRLGGLDVLVNNAGVSGATAPLEQPALDAAYAAAKWGIVGPTKTMSTELGPAGIRVNAIQPRMVEGPRVERVMREKATAMGMSYEDYLARSLPRISFRRAVTADDIAAAMILLVSPAERNISGHAIAIDTDVISLT